MRTYKVNATAHLCVHTIVQASSKKEAIAKAKAYGEWGDGQGIALYASDANIADFEADVVKGSET